MQSFRGRHRQSWNVVLSHSLLTHRGDDVSNLKAHENHDGGGEIDEHGHPNPDSASKKRLSPICSLKEGVIVMRRGSRNLAEVTDPESYLTGVLWGVRKSMCLLTVRRPSTKVDSPLGSKPKACGRFLTGYGERDFSEEGQRSGRGNRSESEEEDEEGERKGMGAFHGELRPEKLVEFDGRWGLVGFGGLRWVGEKIQFMGQPAYYSKKRRAALEKMQQRASLLDGAAEADFKAEESLDVGTECH